MYEKALQAYERAYALQPDFDPHWTFKAMLFVMDKMCAPSVEIKNKFEQWICNHFDKINFLQYTRFLKRNFPQISVECRVSSVRIYTAVRSNSPNCQFDLFTEWAMLTEAYRKDLRENLPGLALRLTKISNNALENLQDLKTQFDRCTINLIHSFLFSI